MNALIYLLENLGTPKEISKTTNARDKVPGNDEGPKDKRAMPPKPENKEIKTRGSHDDQRSTSSSHCLTSVTPIWKIQFSFQGNSSSPAILQGITERLDSSTESEQLALRHSLHPVISCHKGVREVEHPADELVWEESGLKATRPPDRIGCILQRVESIMPRDTDWRSLVPAGVTTGHKLPRAASSDTSCQNLLKGSQKQECSAPRQPHSISLRK
uniref:Uncharacterized protein n=1 Tax=Amphimedon queenslandica TaxID=400682 RepID=A0A1X7U9D5_AMPQE